MCGICGILNFRSKSDPGPSADRDTLEAMNRQILHRGPDEDGFFLSGSVGLAMRRLSIIDVECGHQPTPNEDRNVWLVFNGEIYNHQNLRRQMEQCGHRYRSHSDTETIVHLYEQYGPECVHHLRGMFAFVIWDARKRTLFAARDRLGIKPFYFSLTPEHFLFASEIKALLAHPEIRAQLNRAALPEYLAFGYLSGNRTLFAGIHKLLPGHTLQIDEHGEARIEQYWDVPQQAWNEPRNAKSQTHPEKYYVDTYRQLLEDSVRSHLMSDVPLGMFLSGGLDSSAIAALMSKIRSEPIETFAVGYDDLAYSELGYARTVARHIGSIHHEVRVSSADFFGALPKLIWHEDEPLAGPASVPLYFVSRLAREHVKVVLSGEGSDETLGGYARYRWTLWNCRLDRIYRSATSSQFRQIVRHQIENSGYLRAATRRRLQHTFLGRDAACWSSFYFDNFYCALSAADQADLLLPGFNGGSNSAGDDSTNSSSAYRDSLAYWEKARGSLLDRLLYTDIKTYLVELCMKQDQMSMAASIESRVPFLDHGLVEFAASIPAQFKVRGHAGKLVLKSAVKDLLPASIIHRRKMGFTTPFSKWMLGAELDRLETLLLSPRSQRRELFRPEAVRQLFAEHRALYRDHSDRIWRLLNLELWHRVFIDRDPAVFDPTTVLGSGITGR